MTLELRKGLLTQNINLCRRSLYHAHVSTEYFREGYQVPFQETLQNIVIAATFLTLPSYS
jgi:hypothetical protein